MFTYSIEFIKKGKKFFFQNIIEIDIYLKYFQQFINYTVKLK
jgi:hypothetical protein